MDVQTTQTSPDSLNWVNDSRQTSTYHPNDTSTGQSFIDNVSLYLPRLFLMNGGMQFAMLNTVYEEEWDSGAWVGDYMDTYTYDAEDNLTEEISETLDTGTWMSEWRMEYLYDIDGNCSQTIEYDFNNIEWEPYERISYTWSDNVANDEEVQPVRTGCLAVFPSPFTNQVQIKSDFVDVNHIEYKVYNVKGQVVRTLESINNQEVTWDGKDERGNSTSSGIYLIRATAGDNTATTKTLKLK
ncbi:MAG: T9SS type A sorting domain-containing protein [Candidatus Zophobacter franzmannii]|nr:T9SS type A sorting domain-containing protein [Candidatus Zophobacter franzmannii]